MQFVRSAFVLTLGISLLGGLLFVAAQALAIITGQGSWLAPLNQTGKIPVVVAASLCAIFGFLLTYASPSEGGRDVELPDADA